MALKLASDSTETSNPTVQLLVTEKIVTEAQIKKEVDLLLSKIAKDC
jgi:hypothetical protein